jgi:hypothetical protein
MPIPESKILPALQSTYKMLGLNEAADKIERFSRDEADKAFFSRESRSRRSRDLKDNLNYTGPVACAAAVVGVVMVCYAAPLNPFVATFDTFFALKAGV